MILISYMDDSKHFSSHFNYSALKCNGLINFNCVCFWNYLVLELRGCFLIKLNNNELNTVNVFLESIQWIRIECISMNIKLRTIVGI